MPKFLKNPQNFEKYRKNPKNFIKKREKIKIKFSIYYYRDMPVSKSEPPP